MTSTATVASEAEGETTLAAQTPPGLTLQTPEACSQLSFEQHYTLGPHIAKGSFGTVYTALHVSTNEEYAVKVIDRQKLGDRETQAVVREVTILRDATSLPCIVRLVDFFASATSFHVVQVYARGGDLFARLAAQKSRYHEGKARDVAVYLLTAMQALHERKIVHRDLKPDNLLLEDLIDDCKILVADFGFACYVPKEGLKTRCGSEYRL